MYYYYEFVYGMIDINIYVFPLDSPLTWMRMKIKNTNCCSFKSFYNWHHKVMSTLKKVGFWWEKAGTSLTPILLRAFLPKNCKFRPTQSDWTRKQNKAEFSRFHFDMPVFGITPIDTEICMYKIPTFIIGRYWEK